MSRARAVLLGAALLFLATTISAHPALLAEQHGSAEYPDCLYLLANLDRALGYATRFDPSGATLVEYLKKARVEPAIARLHADTYTLLSRYFDVFVRGGLQEDPRSAIRVINEISAALDKVYSYAERLHQCSHDKGASRELLVYVGSKVSELRGTLLNTLNALVAATQLDIAVEIAPVKAVYEPGEEITLLISGVSAESQLVEPVVFTYPAMRVVPLNYTVEARGENVALRIEVPSAISIEEAGLTEVAKGGVVDLALALRVNSHVRVVKLVRVEYGYPDVRIRMPVATRRGDVFDVYVEATGDYSATLALNGVNLASVALQPGLNRVLVVNTLSSPVKVGTNKLEVCVSATARTLSKCYQFFFAVEPRYPRVTIHVPSPALTLTGFLSVAIYGEEPVELYCEISSGLGQDAFVLSGVATRRLQGGFLPVQLVNVRVEVTDPAGVYDKLVLSRGVVVINATSLLALVAVAALASALAHPYERYLVSFLAKSLGKAITPLPRPSPLDRVRSELLKPLTLGLLSSVAQLYYKALRKLGVRQPLPSETLREHFESGVKASSLPERARVLLWKLMLLAERDLYSANKPGHEEARRVYEDVLDVAEK